MIKRICNVKIYIVLIIILSAYSTLAQSNQGLKNLTMEQAINRALSDNNILKANYNSVMQASWDVKRAWAEMFPTLSFNSRYSWIDDQTFAERDFSRYFVDAPFEIPQTVFQESYYSSFDVNFPLFNGVLLNGLSIAYEKETMNEELSESAKEQTIYSVVSTYLEVLKNRELLKLQEDYLELSKLNYEKAQRLFEASRYSQNEALRWKIDFQQQKSSVVKSEADLRTSLLSLSRLINNTVNDGTVIDTRITSGLEIEKQKILDMNKDQIIELVQLSDGELTQANSSLAAAKSGEEISRLLHRNSYSSYLPKLNLSYSYAWRENNTIGLDDYSPKNLMVTLSVPIFSGFQNYTKLKSTLYEYKKTQEEFEDQLLNTKLILTNVANNLVTIKAQLDLTKSNVEFSKNNYVVVERQREKGLASNIDYIDAKLKLQEANINYIGMNYSFIMSVVELYYLTGKIENLLQ